MADLNLPIASTPDAEKTSSDNKALSTPVTHPNNIVTPITPTTYPSDVAIPVMSKNKFIWSDLEKLLDLTNEEKLLAPMSGPNVELYRSTKRKAVEDFESSPHKMQHENTTILTQSVLNVQLHICQQKIVLCNIAKKGIKDALSEKMIDKYSWWELHKSLTADLNEAEMRDSQFLANSARLREDIFDSIAGSDFSQVPVEVLLCDLLMKVKRAGGFGPRHVRDENAVFKFNTRANFCETVYTEYNTRKTIPNPKASQNKDYARKIKVFWCPVIGRYIRGGDRNFKCAHIVPASLTAETDLAYLFGSPDENLKQWRNGIGMASAIERAFDKMQIVLYPVATKDSNDPSEWIVKVLDKDILNETIVFETAEGHVVIPWSSLDGRQLQWLNGIRPARRYMFLRYALAVIHAQVHFSYSNSISELPCGSVWASPARPDGYIRHSLLVAIGHAIGDVVLPEKLFPETLLEDLITFQNCNVIPTTEFMDKWNSHKIREALEKLHSKHFDDSASEEESDAHEDVYSEYW